MDMIEIDGSYGEGGGQILRTALSLSCITGEAVKFFNIRKGRKKPGLMPQHTTCVNAVAKISNAQVSGNDIGSNSLIFQPEKISAGNYTFDIKTAGSSSLVFQTLLPPLLFAHKPSLITIKGGTHVLLSPTYHYISEVFIPLLKRIGLHVECSIIRYGFYPRGGGETSFRIFPAEQIRGIHLLSKGSLLSLNGYSGVSRLPLTIAERQKKSLLLKIALLSADIKTLDVPSVSEGTFVFLKGEYENVLSGFSSLGKRGKPAESVGEEAAAAFLDFHNSRLCLDPYLADQIVVYLGLSREHSSFTTSHITQHLLTNLWVIEKFLNVRYQVEGEMHSAGKVLIELKI
jgi:RNA 3'-terminal phosphate cyclase (ATP)